MRLSLKLILSKIALVAASATRTRSSHLNWVVLKLLSKLAFACRPHNTSHAVMTNVVLLATVMGLLGYHLHPHHHYHHLHLHHKRTQAQTVHLFLLLLQLIKRAAWTMQLHFTSVEQK